MSVWAFGSWKSIQNDSSISMPAKANKYIVSMSIACFVFSFKEWLISVFSPSLESCWGDYHVLTSSLSLVPLR